MAWRTVVHWLEPFLGEREQLALGARGTLGGDHRDRGARLGGESQAAGRHEVTGRAKRQESEHVWGCSREVAASRCNGKLHEAPCWWPSGLVGLGGSRGSWWTPWLAMGNSEWRPAGEHLPRCLLPPPRCLRGAAEIQLVENLVNRHAHRTAALAATPLIIAAAPHARLQLRITGAAHN